MSEASLKRRVQTLEARSGTQPDRAKEFHRYLEKVFTEELLSEAELIETEEAFDAKMEMWRKEDSAKLCAGRKR